MTNNVILILYIYSIQGRVLCTFFEYYVTIYCFISASSGIGLKYAMIFFSDLTHN